MALKSAADVVVRLQKVEKALGPAAQKKRMTEVGVRLKVVGKSAVAGELGGNALYSRWPGTDALDVAFKHHSTPGGITMHRTRGSAGPWAVATEGRNQGNASGVSGPGINTRTGVTSRTKSGGLRKTRARAAKRWSGTTKPLHTWDKAAAAMGDRAPKIMRDLNREAVFDAFKGAV